MTPELKRQSARADATATFVYTVEPGTFTLSEQSGRGCTFDVHEVTVIVSYTAEVTVVAHGKRVLASGKVGAACAQKYPTWRSVAIPEALAPYIVAARDAAQKVLTNEIDYLTGQVTGAVWR